MSALFDFNAFLIVVLLTICTCTYVKTRAPRLLSVKTGSVAPWVPLAYFSIACCTGTSHMTSCRHAVCRHLVDAILISHRFRGLFWKAARIGMC